MKIIFSLFLLLASLASHAQGDCPAAQVCAGGSFTAQSGGTDELGGGNNGCLSSNEASSSYWFRICTLTAGTIQFAINPSGANNDYDFAVWSGSNCPPTAAPIRCSYSLVTGSGGNGDITGVNSANNSPSTDNSEGAGGNQWVQDINAAAGQCYIININNYGNGSDAFALSFGGTATLTCVALPIELLSFTGQVDGSNNFLEWKCASELNNEHFRLEKSTDGVNYSLANIVLGAGTSNTVTRYVMVDPNYKRGSYNYYKLSQVDFDGREEVLGVVAIDNTESTDPVVVKRVDVLGNEVKTDHIGIYIEI